LLSSLVCAAAPAVETALFLIIVLLSCEVETEEEEEEEEEEDCCLCARFGSTYVVTHSFIHSFEERESAMRRRKSL